MASCSANPQAVVRGAGLAATALLKEVNPIEVAELLQEPVTTERPVLRISYDADLDLLMALVPGEVVDGHLDDEVEVVAGIENEDGDVEEVLWFFTRGSDGPLIGFGVAEAFAWDLSEEPADAPIWGEPRFDVPTLALRDASIGEILLAAQGTLQGSTPDVLAFDLAVAAGSEGDWETAEDYWRHCLATGEMKAHFGLGYALVELGRPREAFGHLAMYTEICPRNAWAWLWRGRAAEDMGERAEARRCYQRAIECEALGSYETDAEDRLASLDGEG